MRPGIANFEDHWNIPVENFEMMRLEVGAHMERQAIGSNGERRFTEERIAAAVVVRHARADRFPRFP